MLRFVIFQVDLMLKKITKKKYKFSSLPFTQKNLVARNPGLSTCYKYYYNVSKVT